MIQVTAINGMGAISESGGTYTTTGMEANDHMHISEDFVRNPGVVSISDGDYKVTQSDTPGKSVKVASGRAYVLNSDYAISSLSEQKFWRCKADVAEDVAISDNTSGNPRIDIICIKVDTTATPDDEATNVASLVVIEGIPGATPSIPATPDNHLKLAEVAVANGFSSVVNANITDTRSEVTIADNAGGWISAEETWVYVSTDDPTGVFKVQADVTGVLSVGMKIKMTNGGNTIHGIITKMGTYGGDEAGYTYITFLHEIDPTDSLALNLMANSTITNPYYSSQKAPFGFPTSPKNWTVYSISSSRVTDTTGSALWIDANPSVSLPIGTWLPRVSASVRATRASSSTSQAWVGISLAGSAPTTPYIWFNGGIYPANPNDAILNVAGYGVILEVTSKTATKLQVKSGVSSTTSIIVYNDVQLGLLSFQCAYL